MLKITILAENLVRRSGLRAEHGLSLWIEDDGSKRETVLFDGGQSDLFRQNADRLGIDLSATDAIVLSHGHNDHGGGLPAFPAAGQGPRIFMHPAALEPKFSRGGNADNQPEGCGLPWQPSDQPQLTHRLMWNTETVQVANRMIAITDIPRSVDFETLSGDLLVERDGQLVPDAMTDEQILVIDRPQGLVVIVGCSHRGIVNILTHVQRLFPGGRIDTVIGGMHLEKIGAERLQKTIAAFREMDIRQIVPLHCTGQGVIWDMKRELGDRVLIRCTGDTIEID